MGTPKAELEWHGSTMLYRTVAILARVTDGPVVVVRAPGQALPDLPEGTLVTADPRAGKGPVQGIAAGLTALEGRADVAFVGSTDIPFLHPAFVRRVLRALDDRDDADVALPFARGYRQPLAAAYRVRLADTAERLAEAGRLRPAFLFEQCRVETLDDDELRHDALLAALDPDLDSVVNVNTPEDYEAARARPAPAVTVRLFGALARGDDTGRPRAARLGTGTGTGTAVIVSAATVGGAADAVGLTFGPHVTAALNADRITCDARTPLTTGDTVFFLPTSGR
jgi:molybdopterin-guanine dinucleotide biosynthesis protein A